MVSNYFQKLYKSFDYMDLVLVLISVLIGLAIGAEREYRNKSAGLRTLMLVSFGSCIFTMLSLKIGVENPDRLAANIITGIGFLGAGAIFKDENKVNGLTTACTIWITAALGMCVGSGHIYLGIFAAIGVFIVLWNLVNLEKWIDKKNRVRVYKITTAYTPEAIPRFEKIFEKHHVGVSRAITLRNGDSFTIHWRISGSKKHHQALGDFLLNDKFINQIEF